jgi:hypothetical protein
MDDNTFLEFDIWNAEERSHVRNFANQDIIHIEFSSKCPGFIYQKVKDVLCSKEREKKAIRLTRDILDIYINNNTRHDYCSVEDITTEDFPGLLFESIGKLYYHMDECDTLKVVIIYSYKFRKVVVHHCEFFPGKIFNSDGVARKTKIGLIREIKTRLRRKMFQNKRSSF